MTEHSFGESVPASYKSEAWCQTALADLRYTDKRKTRRSDVARNQDVYRKLLTLDSIQKEE